MAKPSPTEKATGKPPHTKKGDGKTVARGGGLIRPSLLLYTR